MKLILPDKQKIFLPGGKSYEERLQIINDILKQYTDYFTTYWDNRKTIVCLDVMSNYLARSPEFRDKNYPNLAANRETKLEQGDWNCRPFSDLPKHIKTKIGIEDVTEDNYEE